ncbi:MAG: mechanosensitive ion channel family protein [Thermoanaerobaculia bacterium]
MNVTPDSSSVLLSQGWTDLLQTRPSDWLPALVAFSVVAVVGWVFRWLLERSLGRLAARTRTRVDDVMVEAARKFWLPGIVLLALAAATHISPLRTESGGLVVRIFLSGFLLVLVLASARVVEAWLGERASEGTGPQSTLLQTSARVAVLAAGFLLVLDNLGVQIAPLLTALGVGSIAVGLALQPTLSNFFAGMHLSMAKPIRVGDFIELEDGTQGHVLDIGWRATKLSQPANNLLVVPNGRLAEMRLINYSLPDGPQNIVLGLSVAYGSDLPRVEKVTLDVARSIQRETPEADPDHEPFARFHTFGDSAIAFNVVLRARSYPDRFPLIHAFVKAIHARYVAEGIEIPFPQRVVHLQGESTKG